MTLEEIQKDILEKIDRLSNPRDKELLLETLMTDLYELHTNISNSDRSLERMFDHAEEAHGKPLNRRSTSPLHNLLFPHAAENDFMSIVWQIRLWNTNILRATGSNLDRNFGDNWQVPRIQAMPTIRYALAVDSNGNAVQLPDNAILTPITLDNLPFDFRVVDFDADSGLNIIESIEHSGLGNSFEGALIPRTSGVNAESITLGEVISAGRSIETDRDYRRRLIEVITQPIFGGNIWQYRKAFADLFGITNTIIFPAWRGGSTSRVFVLDNAFNPVDNEVLEAMQALVDPIVTFADGTQGSGLGIGDPVFGLPIGHECTFSTAEEVVVDLEIDLVLRNNVVIGQVSGQVEELISNYINDIRRSVVELWEESVLSGSVFDVVDERNIGGYRIISIHYDISLVWAEIVARLMSIRLIQDVPSVKINGLQQNFVINQNKDEVKIPKLGSIDINVV